MVDRPDREVAFEVFEGFFDLGQLHVKGPEHRGVFVAEVAAQQVAAFATAGFTQFLLAQREAQFAFRAHFDLHQAPPDRGCRFGLPELDEQLVAFDFHALEFFEPFPELFELAPAHGALFADPITALGQDVKFALPAAGV